MSYHFYFLHVWFSYYRGADGILIVYDTTDKESFHHVESWLQEVNKYASDTTVKVLVGNKSDKESERVVSTEEGRKKADQLGLSFIETSAKDSVHIEEAFALISRQLVCIREQSVAPIQPTSVVGLTAAREQINTCCSG